jgi:hypothetical protein
VNTAILIGAFLSPKMRGTAFWNVDDGNPSHMEAAFSPCLKPTSNGRRKSMKTELNIFFMVSSLERVSTRHFLQLHTLDLRHLHHVLVPKPSGSQALRVRSLILTFPGGLYFHWLKRAASRSSRSSRPEVWPRLGCRVSMRSIRSTCYCPDSSDPHRMFRAP